MTSVVRFFSYRVAETKRKLWIGAEALFDHKPFMLANLRIYKQRLVTLLLVTQLLGKSVLQGNVTRD
ncbi:hypothetical protein CWO31_01200 [Vibrio splendidus]|nr:hypothetical protein BCT55_22855 [Vibrio splendidus]PTP69027.1 hypothetical protein CWO31_01200 [Vibrio splendidus]